MATGRHRLNLSAAAASIATALTLLAIKGWAQLQTGSLSIAASLVDSALDLMIAVANLLAMLYAARPADEDHRFGHASAEDIAALTQAALVTAAGIALVWSAASRLIEPAPLTAEVEGAAAMLAALALTAALVWWQGRVARRTGSRIVAADRAHYLSDFTPMLASLIALAASRFFAAHWLDPALALAAAIWILRIGYGLGRGALDGLMDREAPAETLARLAALAESEPGLIGWHDLKTRMSGAKLFVQIHIELDGDMTLREAHAVGARLRRRILDLGGEIEVIVHHDPA